MSVEDPLSQFWSDICIAVKWAGGTSTPPLPFLLLVKLNTLSDTLIEQSISSRGSTA